MQHLQALTVTSVKPLVSVTACSLSYQLPDAAVHGWWDLGPLGVWLLFHTCSSSCSDNWRLVPADVDGCGANIFPCDSLYQARPGSCQDVPAPGTGFSCGCYNGYSWVQSQAACQYIPTCGAVLDPSINGTQPYQCPNHYTYDGNAAAVTNVSTAACCQFVPECGYYLEDGSSYPCPLGFVIDATKASMASPNATNCCKAPAQGVCEVPNVLPVVYSPRGTATDTVPVLVVFPTPESRDYYCPLRSTGNMCYLRMTRLPMFASSTESSNTSSTTTGVLYEHYEQAVMCAGYTSLSCHFDLALPVNQSSPDASDGRWLVDMMPDLANVTFCQDQTTVLQPASVEVSSTSCPACSRAACKACI